MNKVLHQKLIPVILFSILIVSFKGVARDSDYYGFRCLYFNFEGHDAKIVFPEKAEPQHHWIWRARFRGHEPLPVKSLMSVNFRSDLENCRIKFENEKKDELLFWEDLSLLIRDGG